jgi:site-specific DNA-adenine methylase
VNCSRTLFYLDPPYYKKEFYYKNHNFLNPQNHIDLSNILKNIDGKFLLSYQNNDFIIDLYKDINVYYYKGQSVFLRLKLQLQIIKNQLVLIFLYDV